MALWDITDSLLDSVYEIKNSGKKRHLFKCNIVIFDEHLNGETYKGMLDDSKQFAFLPDGKRVLIEPTVFNVDGEKIVYAPEGSFGHLNYKFLKGVALAQRYDAVVKWQHLRKWVTTKVESHRSIDWSLLNDTTGLSRSFSASSFLVLQTKALEFLKNTSDLKLLFGLLMAFFFGCCVGFVSEAMINLVYRMIQ